MYIRPIRSSELLQWILDRDYIEPTTADLLTEELINNFDILIHSKEPI